ncbi:MAG: toll/interleukin-1 receptor domain-containing protein [Opitutus sp.]|nr:toll/interleukin-1 receptor domain-containing protein [Opitutus sp.]
MPDGSKAVFLSYASQDADAARRICEALRAAGIEVWFDQSELVGGDAWDGKIRQQTPSTENPISYQSPPRVETPSVGIDGVLMERG